MAGYAVESEAVAAAADVDSDDDGDDDDEELRADKAALILVEAQASAAPSDRTAGSKRRRPSQAVSLTPAQRTRDRQLAISEPHLALYGLSAEGVRNLLKSCISLPVVVDLDLTVLVPSSIGNAEYTALHAWKHDGEPFRYLARAISALAKRLVSIAEAAPAASRLLIACMPNTVGNENGGTTSRMTAWAVTAANAANVRLGRVAWHVDAVFMKVPSRVGEAKKAPITRSATALRDAVHLRGRSLALNIDVRRYAHVLLLDDSASSGSTLAAGMIVLHEASVPGGRAAGLDVGSAVSSAVVCSASTRDFSEKLPRAQWLSAGGSGSIDAALHPGMTDAAPSARPTPHDSAVEAAYVVVSASGEPALKTDPSGAISKALLTCLTLEQLALVTSKANRRIVDFSGIFPPADAETAAYIKDAWFKTAGAACAALKKGAADADVLEVLRIALARVPRGYTGPLSVAYAGISENMTGRLTAYARAVKQRCSRFETQLSAHPRYFQIFSVSNVVAVATGAGVSDSAVYDIAEAVGSVISESRKHLGGTSVATPGQYNGNLTTRVFARISQVARALMPLVPGLTKPHARDFVMAYCTARVMMPGELDVCPMLTDFGLDPDDSVGVLVRTACSRPG